MNIRILKGKWTDRSAYEAVSTWLRLSFPNTSSIQAVVAQDDSMAMGAREAVRDGYDAMHRPRLSFIGCDGLPKTGQAWVRCGYLAATVVIPPNLGLAIELLVREFRTGLKTPIRTLTVPGSFPPLEALAPSEVIRAANERGSRCKD